MYSKTMLFNYCTVQQLNNFKVQYVVNHKPVLIIDPWSFKEIACKNQFSPDKGYSP